MTTPTDWEAIERLYRAGVLSLREIAGKYGVSDTAIRKKAKKEEWTRDLAAKIQSKADELVRKREVRAQVRTANLQTEKQLIEATADIIANVRMEHRGDINRARTLANTLFDELAAECNDVEALQKLGELLRQPDDRGIDKLNDLYQKIISMPGRVKAMKDLTDSLKNLVGMEREAYGIDNQEKPKDITHNIMLVPSSAGVDDWEATAQLQQGHILGGS